MEFEAVIGLEVHAQLLTRSKLFCGCSTAFGAPANSQTCPVCLGLPGALPVLNPQAVAMAVRAALALGCRINETSIFARKNYFYPDLPKGYQISQFDRPLGEHGRLEVLSGERTERGNIVNRRKKVIRITRLHMEEDAGKSVHEGMPDSSDKSYVNLNRSGVPLAEIVSDPDFQSSQEAFDYLQHLRKILLYLGVCDGNMEEGSLRCDANVSIRIPGAETLGTRVEIKNLNSFRFLQKALDYEIERQARVLREGGTVTQETRLWDDARGSTFTMRSKEEAHDYRYFPEPDLPPLVVDRAWIDGIERGLPELPGAKVERFMSEYELPADDALLLASTAPLADYFEAAARAAGNARAAANWVTGDLACSLKEGNKSIEESPVKATSLGELVRLVEEEAISGKIAKSAFEEMWRTGDAPRAVIERLGLVQVSDEGTLLAAIEAVMARNPGQLAEYRAGKEKLFGYFVGQVMKETRGQANPKLLNDLLRQALAE